MSETTSFKQPVILKSFQEKQKYPYFFKNENIDNNVYIVQHAYNIPNALYILEIWNREKYNIGEIDRYIEVDIPYTKYLYNKNTDIRKVDVNGGNKDYKVMMYKKGEKIYTVALLKYN